MATITVSNLNSSGAGSFAEALANATDGDKIVFAVAGTIAGEYSTSAEIEIDAGASSGSPRVYPIVLESLDAASATVRGVEAETLVALSLEDCKAASGSASDCENCELGSFSATTFSACVFTSATLTDASYISCSLSGCAITSTGEAHFTQCAFSDTRLIVRGNTTIDQSSFLDCNNTNYGGAIFVCGRGVCAVANTTFNRCASQHGGVCCVSGGRLSMTECELVNCDLYSTADAVLTRCECGNVYLRNRATLIDNEIETLDFPEPEVRYVTSTRDSGDGTFATEIENAEAWSIIKCQVAATHGALSLSKSLHIIGRATIGALSLSSASLRAEKVRVEGAVTMTGWQSAFELDRGDIVNATATNLISCSAVHYPSAYLRNSIISGNSCTAIYNRLVSFDASYCTFAGNYNGNRFVGADGEGCITQSTNDGFLIPPPTTKPATPNADDWNLELLPTSRHATTPTTGYDRKGRKRRFGIGALDAVRIAETGKVKAFLVNNVWQDATGATLANLDGVTDVYIDDGEIHEAVDFAHISGEAYVDTCAACELGMDANVEANDAGEVDYLDGAQLSASFATVRNKTNPIAVVTAEYLTLVNCVETNDFDGMTLTIQGGSYHADDVNVVEANFDGDVIVDSMTVTNGSLGNAIIDSLTIDGVVSSSGAINAVTVNGTLTTSGTIEHLELFGTLNVEQSTTIGYCTASHGVIKVAPSSILRFETVDLGSSCACDGFVVFPADYDLSKSTGARIMHPANLVSASALVEYDQLELTIEKTGDVIVEILDGEAWTILDDFDNMPTEGVFSLRICDGVKFTQVAANRVYYYVGGDEGSFANPNDWAVDSNKEHICTVAPTIDGCVFDCRNYENA